jgi:thiol-disulfide isomerase/thioredoxin
MRLGGAGLIAAVLALAGCKTTDPKPTDKKTDRDPAASATSRPKGKPTWLDDMNRQPGANTGVPKADSWADPKDPNFNVAGEVKGVLAGRVLDPTGRGAKSVFIKIEAVDAKPADKAGAATGILTDANGYFMVRGLKPGQAYNLTAEAQVEGKQLSGIVQTKTPNPTLSIQLREDVAALPGRRAPGGTAAPAPTGALPPPDDQSLIPRADVPMPTTPRPAEEAWSPNGAPATRGVPPSISTPGGNPAPALPPPGPIDTPRPSIPERTADAPKDPRWQPPPVSIPGPVVPPSPPVPPLPPPPKDPDGKTTSRPRRPAGNFSLLDTMERPWDFATSRSGSLVLVEFMTTTCVPCKQSVPVLVGVQSRYGVAGLEVVAVACDDGPASDRIARARKYHQDHNLNYSIYVEPGNVPGQVRDRYGVEGYPTAVLLDAAGAVLWKGHPGNRPELEEAIRRNLGK